MKNELIKWSFSNKVKELNCETPLSHTFGVEQGSAGTGLVLETAHREAHS